MTFVRYATMMRTGDFVPDTTESIVLCKLCDEKISIKQAIMKLRCGIEHHFHTICLFKYVKGNDSCPLCMTNLPKDLFPIIRKLSIQ